MNAFSAQAETNAEYTALGEHAESD